MQQNIFANVAGSRRSNNYICNMQHMLCCAVQHGPSFSFNYSDNFGRQGPRLLAWKLGQRTGREQCSARYCVGIIGVTGAGAGVAVVGRLLTVAQTWRIIYTRVYYFQLKWPLGAFS